MMRSSILMACVLAWGCKGEVAVMSQGAGGASSTVTVTSASQSAGGTTTTVTSVSIGSTGDGVPCPPPLSCDAYLAEDDNVCGYQCQVNDPSCVHEGAVCNVCPDKALRIIGAFSCGCGPGSQQVCTLVSGCCTGKDPFECGDFAAMACVQNRCLIPPQEPGKCWQDSDCPDGGTCAGAIICPCGSACETEHPGQCLK